MPDGDGGYLPLTYDLSDYCSSCGIGKKQKDAKRILNDWCDFLTNNPNEFEKLILPTKVPQELFDAVCHQTNLKKLKIKWGGYKDLSKIKNSKGQPYNFQSTVYLAYCIPPPLHRYQIYCDADH